jgi:hypothetical protein
LRDGSRRIYGDRAGRTGLAVLIVLVIAVLLGAAWFASNGARPSSADATTRGGSRSPTRQGEPPLPDAGAPPRFDAATAPDVSRAPADPTASARMDATPSAPVATAPRVRLALQDESGTPLAGECSVLWEAAQPGARAEPVELRARGPELAFDVPARARYRVRVTLGELAGTAVADAVAEPDAQATAVVLHGRRWIWGTILDARDAPLEGVDVYLAPAEAAGLEREAARTDVAGQFRLPLARDVGGRAFVGSVDRPWVTAIDVAPGVGPVLLDPIRLELHAATFAVQLADGTPAVHARVVGTGLDGGGFDERTDLEGRVRVERLPRGRWRVNAVLDPHGRQNRAVEIPLAVDEPVVIVLPR